MYFKNFPYVLYKFRENDEPFEMLHILRKFKINDLFANYVRTWDYYRIRDGETPETVSQKFYKSEAYYWAILIFNDIVNPISGWPMTDVQLRKFVMAKYGPSTREGSITGTLSTDLGGTTSMTVDQVNIEIPATQNLVEGMEVSGLKIAPGTKIASIQDDNTIVLTIKSLESGDAIVYYSTPFGYGKEYDIHHYVDPIDGEWIVPKEEDKSTFTSVSNFDYEYEVNEAKRIIRIPNRISVEQIAQQAEKIFEESV